MCWVVNTRLLVPDETTETTGAAWSGSGRRKDASLNLNIVVAIGSLRGGGGGSDVTGLVRHKQQNSAYYYISILLFSTDNTPGSGPPVVERASVLFLILHVLRDLSANSPVGAPLPPPNMTLHTQLSVLHLCLPRSLYLQQSTYKRCKSTSVHFQKCPWKFIYTVMNASEFLHTIHHTSNVGCCMSYAKHRVSNAEHRMSKPNIVRHTPNYVRHTPNIVRHAPCIARRMPYMYAIWRASYVTRRTSYVIRRTSYVIAVHRTLFMYTCLPLST
jgi:hypothetical protein